MPRGISRVSGGCRSVASIRFGTFEVRLATAELFHHGRRVRLQHQPFEVLRALLQQPGELVTRDALRQALWPDGVTVDFDQSVNKSIAKLRDALGDTAANPRFIETVPKRGYRFIAPVAHPGPADPAPIPPPPSARRDAWTPVGLGLLAVIATAALVTASRNLEPGDRTAVPGRRDAAPSLAAPAVAAASSPIVAARDAHDRGRLAMARHTRDGIVLGVRQFERAVALSPRYADGYAGLAESWSLLASGGFVDARDGMARARDAANRALMLDPNQARAHAALGRTALILDWDWRVARWHLATALARDPGAAATHRWLALLHGAAGDHDQAVAAARRAVAADPLSLDSHTSLGFVHYLARRFDDAAAELTRTLEIDPGFVPARRHLALVRVQQQRFGEAVDHLQRVAVLDEGSPVAIAELAWAYAAGGDRVRAGITLAALDRVRATSYVSPDNVALVHAALGNTGEAVAWLERAFALRTSALVYLSVDPRWDSLRRDARVRAMITAIGAGRP